jgi:PAS domain S-box-containing protein
MLLISGQVEMLVIGAAKVYFLSHRVPISAMLEFSSDYVIVLDTDQRIIQVNEPVLTLLHEPRASLIGKKIHEVDNPFFGNLPVPEPVRNGQNPGETITELSIVLNKKMLHFRAKLVPTAFEDGSQGMTFILEDITAQKTYEEKLQASEARYRGIVEDQTEFITRFRTDGTLLFVNDSYARYLGKKPSDLPGGHCIPEMNEEDCAELNQALQSLDKDRTVTTIECRVPDESGNVRWISWTIRALFDAEGALHEYQGIGRDITEKKAAAARIKNYIRNMEFLARTSATFADMHDDENIYQFMADRVAELEPEAHVVVLSINPDTKKTSLRAFAGDESWNTVLFQYFGNFLQGDVPMDKTPGVWDLVRQGILVEGPKSLYEQTYRILPEHICNEIDERMSSGKSYGMGCTCRMGIYGNIYLHYRFDNDLTNRETVEAFVRQAGVALQRRYLKEKLRKAEERIKALEGLSPSPGPADQATPIGEGNKAGTLNLSRGTL